MAENLQFLSDQMIKILEELILEAKSENIKKKISKDRLCL